MNAAKKKEWFSVEEYLALEDQCDYKSEYTSGEIYAMSGGSFEHSLISTNINRALGNQLEGSKCTVHDSNLKVEIAATSSYFYPDALVLCGPPQFTLGRRDIIKNPTLIIEVLSKSTQDWDRTGKLKAYQSLPSLKEHILINQYSPQVELLSKNAEGKWIFESFLMLENLVRIPSLNIEISLAEIYANVEFQEPIQPLSNPKE